MKKRVYKKSSKPGVPCKADCKGSNFRGLHNMDKETVSYLLNEMANKSLPLHKLNATCQEMTRFEENVFRAAWGFYLGGGTSQLPIKK